jgi:hypothetical protein
MTSHAAAAAAKTQAADKRAGHAPQLAAEQLASVAAHNVVAASGGSVTTSREPLGEWAKSTASQHASPQVAKAAITRTSHPQATPAKVVKPATAGEFAKVSMATRIPEMAKWIAARPSFTFAEAAAASAPSPCSPTVMAYTLPDARLTSALAELGYLVTAGGKNGYTVTAIKALAKPEPTRAAKGPAGS